MGFISIVINYVIFSMVMQQSLGCVNVSHEETPFYFSSTVRRFSHICGIIGPFLNFLIVPQGLKLHLFNLLMF